MTEDIEKMSGDEKLRQMEALWESLSREEARLESPPWYKEALLETVPGREQSHPLRQMKRACFF